MAAEEVAGSTREIADPAVADEYPARFTQDLQDDSCPPGVNSPDRSIGRGQPQITSTDRSQLSNGPTEPTNNPTRSIERVASGITGYGNFRIRALLYTGRSNRQRLATLTTR